MNVAKISPEERIARAKARFEKAHKEALETVEEVIQEAKRETAKLLKQAEGNGNGNGTHGPKPEVKP